MRAPVLLLILGACGPAQRSADVAQQPAPSAESQPPPSLDGLAALVHDATNQARDAEGREALRWRDDLAAVARRHSEDMAARDFFAHDDPDGRSPNDRALAAGIACEISLGGGSRRLGVAENLFMTTTYERVSVRRDLSGETRTVDWFTPSEIASAVVDGWLDSPGHRRNLLDRTSRAHGIGVATDAEDRAFITQVLC